MPSLTKGHASVTLSSGAKSSRETPPNPPGGPGGPCRPGARIRTTRRACSVTVAPLPDNQEPGNEPALARSDPTFDLVESHPAERELARGFERRRPKYFALDGVHCELGVHIGVD